MGFWKNIGDGLGKAGKEVGDFFVKDIPHFVTKTIPSVAKRETYAPDLPPLRDEVASLRENLNATQDEFFAERGRLQVAEARYSDLSEKFSGTDASTQVSIDTTVRLAREVSDLENTLGDVVSATRTVTGIVTLGLAELLFMQGDNSREREELNNERVVLKGMIKRNRRAIEEVVSLREDFEAEIALLEQKLEAAGLDTGANAASALTAHDAEHQMRLDMAARYLVSMPPELVAQMTGLSLEALEGIAPLPAPDSNGAVSDPAGQLSDEEKTLIEAARAEETK